MRGKKKKKILASEDGSCFPDSSVFHFCQSSPVRSAGNPALHLKTSSIFSIGPLTDQSCTQIIFILWYFLCVFYFEFIFDFVAPSAQKPFKRLSSSRMPKKKKLEALRPVLRLCSGGALPAPVCLQNCADGLCLFGG